MTFLLIYLIGVILGAALLTQRVVKEFGVITVGDVVSLLIFSLTSWIAVLIELLYRINCNKVLWKRKK